LGPKFELCRVWSYILYVNRIALLASIPFMVFFFFLTFRSGGKKKEGLVVKWM
jgi:hypothetical protein